jgi:hypothetical protein
MTSTATATKSSIVADIKAYVAKCGGKYSDWYVGIAADPEQRLFNDHAVSKESGAWIWVRAASSDDARAAEKSLLALGMTGGPGGGDDDSDCVYAYKITSTTQE